MVAGKLEELCDLLKVTVENTLSKTTRQVQHLAFNLMQSEETLPDGGTQRTAFGRRSS